jgi:arylsulfatase A-like enzyme
MAIKWPGVVLPGTKCETPVISNDFFPTIMGMTGISYDNTSIDGKNLIPLLKQKGKIDRDALYFHYPHYHHQGFKPASAIREGDYKLIEWYEETLLDQPGQISLYNIQEDVGETNDLSEKMPELVQRLRNKLHTWRKQVGAQEMTINPDYDPKKAHIKREE